MAEATGSDDGLIRMTIEIVSAFVRHSHVPSSGLPDLIRSVHDSLGQLKIGAMPETKPEELKPAVPIKKSITDDHLISLENGQKFKSLKRHLMTTYGMTPDDYRRKWGLAQDYPMVAPAYAKSRSDLARSMGLGRKAVPTPAPAPAESEAAPVKKRGRPKAGQSVA